MGSFKATDPELKLAPQKRTLLFVRSCTGGSPQGATILTHKAFIGSHLQGLLFLRA